MKILHANLVGFIVLLTAICGASKAAANIPQPRIKPVPSDYSQILGEQDFLLFRRAMTAADHGDWRAVHEFKAGLQDMTARRLLDWREALENPAAELNLFQNIIQGSPDWPRMVALKAKAETKLYENPHSPSFVKSWFATHDPVSGEGRAALAIAHLETGNQSEGLKWLRLAWRESRLSRTRQQELFGRFKSLLTKEDHAARGDYLIWLGRSYYGAAEALQPFMSDDDRKTQRARILIGANRSGMNAAISAVPNALKNDPGIVFERGHWRRIRRSKDYALPAFLELESPPTTERGQERLWREKKIMTYWALSERRYDEAYRLCLNHGMTSGVGFAEAEWLAGWIALTHLNDAVAAEGHFRTMSNGVSTPVSKSRGEYWLGRALSNLGLSEYTQHYSNAARYQNTYYGQLAASALLGDGARVTMPPQLSIADRTSFDVLDTVRALKLIGELQDERLYRQFSFHLDDTLTSSAHLQLLAELAVSYGYYSPSVRAAKQSGRFDTVFTESGYPIPEVFLNLGAKYDIPFALAIARQESEFRLNAVSSARAHGMMQMINSTARATARQNGKTYKQFWLTADPNYSAELGADHLQDLLGNYDGSYILTAVAYNAGPHRVRQWIKEYGDPRTGQIDPVDWIETIPFSETRNYVQRVMENLQVYRARLSNGDAELRLQSDLRRGG